MGNGQNGFLTTITNGIEKIETVIITILFTEVIFVGFAQVLARFVFKSSLPWSEELLRFSFIWLTYMASSLGIMKGTHASVDVILDRLPRVPQNLVRLVNEILTFVFCATIFYLSLQVVGMQIQRSQISAAMGLPMYVPYGGLVIAFFFMTIQCLSRNITAIKRLAAGPEAQK